MRVGARITPVLLLLSAMGLCAPARGQDHTVRSGDWRAWLETPIGELPFRLHLEQDQELRAWIGNGSERAPLTDVRWEGHSLVLEFLDYEALIRVTVSDDGSTMDGLWRRSLAGGRMATLRFHATHGYESRFLPLKASGDGFVSADRLASRWRLQLGDYDVPSVAEIRAEASGLVTGTMINTSGDYRYLEGTFERNTLRLSRFDGAHAFLVHAELQEDGRLVGTFQEGSYRSTSMVAWPDEQAQAPDPFDQFEYSGRVDLSSADFFDLTGERRSLGDVAPGSKAVIVELMGTWCPNCHDASQLLARLRDEYHERGLSVVALAFEMTTDADRNRRSLRRYVARNGVTYPVLMAFGAEARQPEDVFPQVSGRFYFPTILFLRGDGTIEAVHTGFTGPATGQAHVELQAEFRRRVESMLAADP